jgi:opacity protein-like surface antigen
MNLLKKSILAASAIALMTGAAYAADPVMYSEPATIAADDGFDWDGFYAGVGLSIDAITDGGPVDNYGYIDAIVGYNYTHEQILFGAEAWVGGYWDVETGTDSGFGGGVEGRVGYLATDDWLIYTGIGYYVYDGGADYVTVGIGTEFAVTDDMSIDIEYKHWEGLSNSFAGPSVGTSLLWHF